MFLGFYFISRRKIWRVTPFSEQRVQIGPERYRIPDVCVVSIDTPVGLILTSPTILCVEILSREDRMTDMLERVDDYQRMGVTAVRVIDPWLLKAFYTNSDGSLLYEPQALRVPNSPIEFSVAEVFDELASIPRDHQG
jgi:Uma2 family endonuclease